MSLSMHQELTPGSSTFNTIHSLKIGCCHPFIEGNHMILKVLSCYLQIVYSQVEWLQIFAFISFKMVDLKINLVRTHSSKWRQRRSDMFLHSHSKHWRNLPWIMKLWLWKMETPCHLRFLPSKQRSNFWKSRRRETSEFKHSTCRGNSLSIQTVSTPK